MHRILIVVSLANLASKSARLVSWIC